MWNHITSYVDFLEKVKKDKNYEALAMYVASMIVNKNIKTFEEAKSAFENHIKFTGNCDDLVFYCNKYRIYVRYNTAEKSSA